MAITIWIIFYFCLFLAVLFTFKFLTQGLNNLTEVFLWIITVVVIAIGCGMYFSDLDEEIFGRNILGQPTSKVEKVVDTIKDGVEDTVNTIRKELK